MEARLKEPQVQEGEGAGWTAGPREETDPPRLPPLTGQLASWERAMAASISPHLGCWVCGGGWPPRPQVGDPWSWGPAVVGRPGQGGGVTRGGASPEWSGGGKLSTEF